MQCARATRRKSAEERDAGVLVDVLIPVLVADFLAGSGFPARLDVVISGVIRAVVVHEIRGVGGEERRGFAGHEPRHVLGVSRVAAEQLVIAEQPEIARLSDRVLGRLTSTRIFEVRPLLRERAGDQRVHLLGGVADAVERILSAKGLKQLRQGRFIERGDLPDTVICNRVRRRLDVRAREPHDWDALKPKLVRRLEPRVPRDHLARGFRHDRLLPPEPSDRVRDRADRLVVVARVGGVAEQVADRDPLDLEFRVYRFQVRSSRVRGLAATWNSARRARRLVYFEAIRSIGSSLDETNRMQRGAAVLAGRDRALSILVNRKLAGIAQRGLLLAPQHQPASARAWAEAGRAQVANWAEGLEGRVQECREAGHAARQ